MPAWRDLARCNPSAMRMSLNMSLVSFVPPSIPNPTCTPARLNSGKRMTPEARRMLLSGL
ncbi:MAG TPA: hypothetical protein VNL74_04640 [Methylococcus sp.]|nr:hypothetical protein [Methylococcus sp.]